MDASRESAESAATLALVTLGLWTLYELARPLDRVRTLLLVGLVAGAVGAFTIPFVADFFSLEVPPADVALTIAAAVALAVPAITIGIRAASDRPSAPDAVTGRRRSSVDALRRRSTRAAVAPAFGGAGELARRRQQSGAAQPLHQLDRVE